MLAFSTDDLAKKFRSEVDDKLDDNNSDVDCLWKNDDTYGYMTEAVDRLAKDTEEWTKLVVLPVTAGQQFLQLPRNVHRIRQARLVNHNWYLMPYNIVESTFIPYDDYGDYHVGSASLFRTTGDPRHYFLDYDSKKMMLGPIPGTAFVDDTVEALCVVTLAVPMQPGLPVPFMDTGDQRCILEYMKYLAYSKQDADTLDLQRADTFEKSYEKKVSDRSYEVKRRRQEAPIVRSDW